MNYAVDILIKANGSLEGDNLKGERRWERQAARALIDAGRQVGSVSDAWANPDAPNWNGIVPVTGRTLIAQADPGTVRYKPGAANFVTNVFCGLTSEAEAEIRRAIAEMGRERVFLTHSFQVNVALKRLPEDLHDRIRWLPVPAVPHVHWNHDPWQNKVLLWAARAMTFHLREPSQTILDLLDWIRGCLKEDPALQFQVLCSEERIDQAGADSWVWSIPIFAKVFDEVRSQIRVHPSLSWTQVMGVFAHTKLCVNYPTSFGGQPLEAASYGIPVLGTKFSLFHKTVPETARWPFAADAVDPEPGFPEFVGFVGVSSKDGTSRGSECDKLVPQLDLWMRDADAYRKAGSGYRRYVHDTYTYAEFVRNLDLLIGPWT